MRVAGHNLVAILVAAIVMYGIGALIYGVLFSAQWMALAGYREEDFAGQEWRMALSPIMPLLIAFGVSTAINWRGVGTLAGGLTTGLLVGVFFLFAGRLYAFVYGNEPAGLLAMDTAHLVLIAAVGGAIIGGWPKPKAV